MLEGWKVQIAWMDICTHGQIIGKLFLPVWADFQQDVTTHAYKLAVIPSSRLPCSSWSNTGKQIELGHQPSLYIKQPWKELRRGGGKLVSPSRDPRSPKVCQISAPDHWEPSGIQHGAATPM